MFDRSFVLKLVCSFQRLFGHSLATEVGTADRSTSDGIRTAGRTEHCTDFGAFDWAGVGTKQATAENE